MRGHRSARATLDAAVSKLGHNNRCMKKIRAAVIGVGYLGRFHAQKYAQIEGCDLVGVVDTDGSSAARAAAETGARACSDYREMLGRVDAVSIVTPTPTHCEIGAAFLQAGAHVLVEKPIAENLAQAERLLRAARQHERVLQVGHLERFNPVILAAEPLLTAPRFIECQRLAPFKERGTDVDVVLDLMIHDIDLLQMIVGSPVAEVDAIGAPVFSSEIDIANARLRFGSGCVANVTASRVSLKTERKLRVFCDDAYLSIDLQQKSLTVIRKRSAPVAADASTGALFGAAALAAQLPVQIEEQCFEPGDALLAEIQAFLAAVRGESRVLVTGEDGLRALTTAIAITARVRGQQAGRAAGSPA
jgi:predicted dehydrogenase